MNPQSPAPLLALSEKASPGPWEDVGPNDQDERCIYAANDYAVAAIIPCGFPETNAKQTVANSAFVVELVNWFRANAETLARSAPELPELPTPAGPWHATSDYEGYYTFTTDQMMAYATEAAAYWYEMHRSLLTAYNELLAAKKSDVPTRQPSDYADGTYGPEDLAAIWNACLSEHIRAAKGDRGL